MADCVEEMGVSIERGRTMENSGGKGSESSKDKSRLWKLGYRR